MFRSRGKEGAAVRQPTRRGGNSGAAGTSGIVAILRRCGNAPDAVTGRYALGGGSSGASVRDGGVSARMPAIVTWPEGGTAWLSGARPIRCIAQGPVTGQAGTGASDSSGAGDAVSCASDERGDSW